ncbi:unnamed protein product [Arctogadus glacialis]
MWPGSLVSTVTCNAFRGASARSELSRCAPPHEGRQRGSDSKADKFGHDHISTETVKDVRMINPTLLQTKSMSPIDANEKDFQTLRCAQPRDDLNLFCGQDSNLLFNATKALHPHARHSASPP